MNTYYLYHLAFFVKFSLKFIIHYLYRIKITPAKPVVL